VNPSGAKAQLTSGQLMYGLKTVPFRAAAYKRGQDMTMDIIQSSNDPSGAKAQLT